MTAHRHYLRIGKVEGDRFFATCPSLAKRLKTSVVRQQQRSAKDLEGASRFDARMLFERGGRANFGSEPFVERFLGFNHQGAGGHGRVGVAAKLGAVDLVTAFFGRLEPERYAHAGNGILSDAHGDYLE